MAMVESNSSRPAWRRWLGNLFGGKRPGRTPTGPDPVPAVAPVRTYTLSQLKAATRNFTRTIGEGGFGVVYKGLLDGKEVAVKKIALTSNDASDRLGVQMEIDVMGSVRHVNVMEMLGMCRERNELFIVSDLMPNGDLEDKLGGLSWELRFAIARGVAGGLSYLHHTAGRAVIVHRDIKSKNILLDHDYRARIADFGLTRLVDPAVGEARTGKLQGTLGYAPGEVEVTSKWDVFSFGVVLLQLLSGQQALSESLYRKKDNRAYLFRRALMDCRSGIQFLQFLDPRFPLTAQEQLNTAKQIFKVALLCIQVNPHHRPEMKEVVQFLAEGGERMPLPRVQAWLRLPGVNPLECDGQTLVSELKALARRLKEGTSWETLAPLSTKPESEVVLAKLAQEDANELPLYFCLKTTGAGSMAQRGRELHKRVCSRGYHPNIVYYLCGKDAPQDSKKLQTCMEYVGESVRSRIDRLGPLKEQDCIRYTRNLLTGLQQVHLCGVIHLGVKCENMLVMDGTADSVKLGGFGSAILDKSHKSHKEAEASMTRWIADGSFDPRAAPNVSTGAGPLMRDADIWSVGIAVHEMLTGRVPYGVQVKEVRPDDTVFIPPPQIETGRLPGPADKFIRRCLRKIKNDQNPTIEELLEDPFLQLPTA